MYYYYIKYIFMGISKTYISKLATALIDELYDLASCDPRIMAINWIAYAYKLIYNETSAFMPYKNSGIDGFIAKDDLGNISQIENLISSKVKLKLLMAWHELHWLKSQILEYEDEYKNIIELRELKLPNFTLA